MKRFKFIKEAIKRNAIFRLSRCLQMTTYHASNIVEKAINTPTLGIESLSKLGITFTGQEKQDIIRLVNEEKIPEAGVIILDKISKEFHDDSPTIKRCI